MIRLLRNLLVKNWGLKLFSLLLALILWLVLIPEEKVVSERTLTVPLETRNRPSNMELVLKPAASIDVTIRAANRILDSITARDVTARLDLASASVYQTEYPLNPSMISLPQGAEVVRITPNKVDLRLEPTRRAQLNVRPNIRGKVKEGFTYSVEVVPEKVYVEGPESKIQPKDEVRTAPVDITDLTQSTVFEADLILPKPELRLATGQTKVQVRIIVEEAKSGGTPPRKKSPSGY